MIDFQNIPIGSSIKIHLNKDNKFLDMDATVIKHIEYTGISIINIKYPTNKVLNFKGVGIYIEYQVNDSRKIRFLKCKLLYHNGNYHLQVSARGVLVNEN